MPNFRTALFFLPNVGTIFFHVIWLSAFRAPHRNKCRFFLCSIVKSIGAGVLARCTNINWCIPRGTCKISSPKFRWSALMLLDKMLYTLRFPNRKCLIKLKRNGQTSEESSNLLDGHEYLITISLSWNFHVGMWVHLSNTENSTLEVRAILMMQLLILRSRNKNETTVHQILLLIGWILVPISLFFTYWSKIISKKTVFMRFCTTTYMHTKTH